MIALDPRTAAAALAPVREALLGRARELGARVLAEADAEATAIVAEAEHEAESIRKEARAQGEADGQAVLGAERARARREARGVVLEAQSELYDELRRRVRQAVTCLRDDPAFPTLQRRLEDQALATLGAEATLTPHPSGGCVGELRGRRGEFSLSAAADRLLDTLGPELEGLWSR